MSAARPIVDVAAAVLLRPDGSFLLGRRPAGRVFSGYWEFPGGKVEAGEEPRQSLVRELKEELGIDVIACYPWITREFEYPHAHVRLHFFRVTRWAGAIRDLEHDALSWQHPGQVRVAPLLPANAPVLAALELPDFYAITAAARFGAQRQLAALEGALRRGLRLAQVREDAMPPAERAAFAAAVVALCRKHGARVLVNGDLELAISAGADGVHLKASQLAAAAGEQRQLPLLAASCHDEEELALAQKRKADFVVLGPVHSTASHPGQPGMGWERFARLANGCPLPIYALGGLAAADMETAWQAGAHGIAAIRAAFGLAEDD